MRCRLLLLTIATMTLVAACTTPQNLQVSKAEADLNAKEQKKLDEYKAEIEIGRNMAGRLLAFYGVDTDEDLVGYINQVGNYVASYSDFPERRYMFQILDSESINAFACPGGYILVTRGAVRHAQNEAELAHVLGHEVAHVGLKHMFDSLKSMSKDDLEKAAKEADKAAMKMSPELKARKRPEVKENDAGALIARYLAGSSAGLNVLSAAKAGMSLILEKGLGAEKELEADASGTRYALRGGYYPKALMNYLCRIDQEKRGIKNAKTCKMPTSNPKTKSKHPSVLEKTHPPVAMRIDNIKKTLVSLDALEAPGARGEARFMAFRSKLIPAKLKEKD